MEVFMGFKSKYRFWVNKHLAVLPNPGMMGDIWGIIPIYSG
jgi:hypothetical protein